MNDVTESHSETPGDSFEQQLGSAMRSGVSIHPHDPSFGDGVRARVRTRQRRRRVMYLGVVLLFAGLLGGLSLGSMMTSDPGSDLATQSIDGQSFDDSVGDGGDANGEREVTPASEGDAASDNAQKPPPVDERLDPPTAWEEAASLLLILGLPLAVGALTVLSGAGRPMRRRVASAVFATLSAQTLVLCVTGVALMYTYQPLPPEIGGASLDSIDQDIGPGIIRGVHAFGSVLFPLLLVVGVLVVIFTLPAGSNASGFVLRLVVAMVSVGWMAEGLYRTGTLIGWDRLAVTDVVAGTDIRGVGRPLDLGTVRGNDSKIVEIISDGKVLGTDGYRSAFVEHVLLAGLIVAVLAAGFVWTRRSMSTTRLTAWVGAWMAAFGVFRFGLYISGVLRARTLVDRLEAERGQEFDTYQCTGILDGTGDAVIQEVHAAGLGGDIFYLWFIPVVLYGGIALAGYGLYASATERFRNKRVIHLVPVVLIAMTAIVLMSLHALGVTSCVLE